MKKLIAGILMTLLPAVFGISAKAQAQSTNVWTNQKAASWYNARTWLNGLSAKPSETINQVEFARQYQPNKAAWDKAFAFLRDTDFSRLRIGKYPIDDENVFAIISEGPPREISPLKWEAHHTYSDIHFVIKGKEKIGIMPVKNAPVNEEYNSTKDIAFYTIENGNFYVAEPGMFFIATPAEAHNPSNKVEGYDGVKKVVVKVRSIP